MLSNTVCKTPGSGKRLCVVPDLPPPPGMGMSPPGNWTTLSSYYQTPSSAQPASSAAAAPWRLYNFPGHPNVSSRPRPVAWKFALDSDVTQEGGSPVSRAPMVGPRPASSFPAIGVSGLFAPPQPAMASGAAKPGRWFPL